MLSVDDRHITLMSILCVDDCNVMTVTSKRALTGLTVDIGGNIDNTYNYSNTYIYC